MFHIWINSSMLCKKNRVLKKTYKISMCRRGYNGISQSDFIQILWKNRDLLHFILSWAKCKTLDTSNKLLESALLCTNNCLRKEVGKNDASPVLFAPVDPLITHTPSMDTLSYGLWEVMGWERYAINRL